MEGLGVTGDGTNGGQTKRLYLLLAPALLVFFAHLTSPTWYDENYALMYFVSPGPTVIFTDYHVPNNHILYSFALWLWQQAAGADLLNSRIFSLLLTSLAIPGLYLAGRALGRREIGLFAAVIFASSHIVGDFSAQLRGYSLSMGVVGLALGFSVAWWKQGHAAHRHALGYAICGALAIGVIPTNAIFVAAIAFWLIFAGTIWRRTDGWRIIGILGTPFLGLAIYLPVWPQFVAAKNIATTAYGDFLRETAGALFLYDLLWLLPLAAAALWWLRKRECFLPFLSLMIAISMTFAVPFLSAVPFSRNYVPLTPFVALLGGWSLATLVALMKRPRWSEATKAGIVVLAIVLFAGGREALLASFEAERWAAAGGKPQSLLDQYYHSPRYNPAAVRTYLAEAPVNSLVVVADDVAMDTLLMTDGRVRQQVATCVVLRGRRGCALLSGNDGTRQQLLVVDRNETEARAAVRSLGIAGDYALAPAYNSGNYFKVWRVHF